MSQLPFFTWHNILCAAVVGAVGVHECVRAACVRAACFLRLPFCPRTRTSLPYTTIFVTHGNTVCVRHVFRVSVKCFSGEKVRWAVSVRAEPSNVRAARQFHSRRRQRRLLRSHCQQMAALNFVNFFFVKWFVKIEREIPSNIKFKKYKIVYKKVVIAYVLFELFKL